MAHQLDTLHQLKLNLLHFSGPLSRNDFDSAFTSPDYDPSFDDLAVYAADASFASVDFNSAKEQAHRLVEDAKNARANKRRAMVTANAMQGVLGRMFLGFVRSFAPSDFEIECFDSLPTAMAWIEAGRTQFDPALDRSLILRSLAELERNSGNFEAGAKSSAG